MKANLTIRLDSELIREAKVLAAQKGTSVSRMMAEQLEELIRREKDYVAAERRALARLESSCDLGWSPADSRDDLHER